MRNVNYKDGSVWTKILPALLLMAATAVSFYLFAANNRERILDLNENYIQDISRQTADRVDDLILAHRKGLDVISLTVAETIGEPWIEKDVLKLLQETSNFDYIEFTDATGCNYNADGTMSDSSDRKNYLEGIKGETGINVIFNSRITHETLIDFYTPVVFEGEIIGVLNGMWRGETLEKAISTELFGITAKSYLCMPDGTVIASYGDENAPENILEGLEASSTVSEEVMGQIQDAFRNRQSLNYVYQGKAGIGNASLKALSESDWLVLQFFPSSLTGAMVGEANAGGAELGVRLLVFFMLYVAFLVWKHIRQRRRLVLEKDQLGWIIEGILPLFSRILIADYDKGTYEYVENAQEGIPEQGSITQLEHFMASHYLDRNGGKTAGNMLTQKMVQKNLRKEVPYLRYEYRMCCEEPRWETVSVMCIKWRSGLAVKVLFAIQDVTELKEYEKKLKEQARTDEMTGLLQKTATQRAVDYVLGRAEGDSYAFFIFDIDRFKQANDWFGHAFGDHVIQYFAKTLRENVRSEDLLGRIGGDEFAALLRISGEDLVRAKAEQFNSALAQDYTEGDFCWHMSASIGVSFAPQDGTTYQELYRKADAALYRVKQSGRGSYAFSEGNQESGKKPVDKQIKV